eukprot:gnl/TRDRNA2_/TRDRNA2_190332_c0_seq1.p1 gnl/TRDRNA2_/TRDRNA2_190332_c0~~gnl/TRDRNA2_/TRDRNA2_190332_c0_seq1.p1  ORF type:complete len:660 (+),score=74.06 gnl/TRDRNA2_/TRDRNA2_190332_c0_seq1:212-1981(+)
MIGVGYDFTIDKENLKEYVKDYAIAMTAAGFPWMFVGLWFMLTLGGGMPIDQALLVARFAAPTSAGILFSMLDAAGLKDSWVFQKARILAIFDDLDTILLMIPLKVLLVGFKMELLISIGIMSALLALSWFKLHKFQLPFAWNWTLLYAAIVAVFCWFIHYATHHFLHIEPIHIEVLLPAFVLGTVIDTPAARSELQLQRTITLQRLSTRSLNSEKAKASVAAAENQNAMLREAAKVEVFEDKDVEVAVPEPTYDFGSPNKTASSLNTSHPPGLVVGMEDQQDIPVISSDGLVKDQIVPKKLNGANGTLPQQADDLPTTTLPDEEDKTRLALPPKVPSSNALISPTTKFQGISDDDMGRSGSKHSTQSKASSGPSSGSGKKNKLGLPNDAGGRRGSKHSTASKSSTSSRSMTRYGAPVGPECGPPGSDQGDSAYEEAAVTAISLMFMVLVGLSMPALLGKNAKDQTGGMSAGEILFHVVMVSILMIVGKMFPVFCYRDEADLKGRTALCLGMCPRGEVGASIIVISLQLGISGPSIIIAMCALGGNLVMSGVFIMLVKQLLREAPPAFDVNVTGTASVTNTPIEKANLC